MGSKGDIILLEMLTFRLLKFFLDLRKLIIMYLLQDPSESLAVIGRYISENYNGAALHPIDFIDITTGQLVAEVMDPNITTISPVNKLHPRDDVLASGSSRLDSASLTESYYSVVVELFASYIHFQNFSFPPQGCHNHSFELALNTFGIVFHSWSSNAIKISLAFARSNQPEMG